MSEPKMEYRVFRLGPEWHWQVFELLAPSTTLASGTALTAHTARTAALSFCHRYEEDHPEQ
jgi:hypothetical protein